MSSATCMILVDDSNVWIEAQKFAASGNSHMPKLQDSDRDPRLRVDIGKLVKRLRCQHRTQGPSFLYGSRPPPNDSVWEAFKRNKFETNIYDCDHGGEEKEVDNSTSVGMTRSATELRVEAKYNLKAANLRVLPICVRGSLQSESQSKRQRKRFRWQYSYRLYANNLISLHYMSGLSESTTLNVK